MQELIDEGCVLFPAKPRRPAAGEEVQERTSRTSSWRFQTIMDDVHTSHGTEEVREIFGFQAFDFPKPVRAAAPFRRTAFLQRRHRYGFLRWFLFDGPCRHGAEPPRRCAPALRLRSAPRAQSDADSEIARRGYTTISQLGLHRIRMAAKLTRRFGREHDADR